MKKYFIMSFLCCLSLSVFSQSITLSSGSLPPFQEERMVEFAYTYDNMSVGKMTEADYIDKKVGDYNEKEAGRGDAWLEAWIGDRQERFEPKFEELFSKHMEKYDFFIDPQEAKYLIIINTDFTEPGFNVGVARKNASINLTCRIIDKATQEEIGVIKIRNSSANDFWGTDFEVGYRIQECYAKAGRELAKFLVKKLKLK
ncbi:hypothetical protein M2137_002660 [Parabacteroides sp. PFB2-10]|uniref:hypothetical protein n=1 Tax=Parabacteroides sp. PFB2-10 TaxID=1742405 RepID=UPI0024742AFA|nr:hypothetical protein [Parabacteroides sp. PFB2-10]MDH6313869.1 hypothetical protein [Parabacteroides sp. PFB2-10]